MIEYARTYVHKHAWIARMKCKSLSYTHCTIIHTVSCKECTKVGLVHMWDVHNVVVVVERERDTSCMIHGYH